MLFEVLRLTAMLLLALSVIACAGRIGIGIASLLAFVAGIFIALGSRNPFHPSAVSLVLTACVGLECLKRGRRVRTFMLGSLASLAVALVLPTVIGFFYVRWCLTLRERFPYVSLAPRLAYEGRPRPASEYTDPGTARRLDETESEVEHSRWPSYADRAASVDLIHHSAVELFINSPGFGPGRRLGPSPWFVEPKDYPLVPFDKPDEGSAADDMLALDAQKPNPAMNTTAFAPSPYFWNNHTNGLADFVNKEGFGHIRDREHVAGFQPHQFRKRVFFGANPENRWLVRRLELVSLLKFEEPAVYLSDHLPRMDRLGDGTTTRPLNSFESGALESLRRGKDLVTSPEGRLCRVLGSIRATRQCLACHTVERGELLGAFSYVLQPGWSSP
jgi:hypothetical protein